MKFIFRALRSTGHMHFYTIKTQHEFAYLITYLILADANILDTMINRCATPPAANVFPPCAALSGNNLRAATFM